MNFKKRKLQWLLTVLLIAVFAIFGCTGVSAGPAKSEACISSSKLNKTISAEASLEEFSCSVKKWKGADTLHLTVKLKNTSNEDQRYKVNIFLENGKAVGGLLPRKTKKGLVKPGQTTSFAYPVKGMTGTPGSVDLIVKTMSK